MPWYEWEKKNARIALWTAPKDVGSLARAMRRLGFRRRYAVPALVVHPTYTEALNQVAEELESADAGVGPRVAQRMPENVEELARGAKG